jgi:pilus assembly protein Flp/PilA
MRLIRKFGRDGKGVTMMEYALIAALVAIAAVTILSTLGKTISSVFSKVNAKMSG